MKTIIYNFIGTTYTFSEIWNPNPRVTHIILSIARGESYSDSTYQECFRNNPTAYPNMSEYTNSHELGIIDDHGVGAGLVSGLDTLSVTAKVEENRRLQIKHLSLYLLLTIVTETESTTGVENVHKDRKMASARVLLDSITTMQTNLFPISTLMLKRGIRTSMQNRNNNPCSWRHPGSPKPTKCKQIRSEMKIMELYTDWILWNLKQPLHLNYILKDFTNSIVPFKIVVIYIATRITDAKKKDWRLLTFSQHCSLMKRPFLQSQEVISVLRKVRNWKFQCKTAEVPEEFYGEAF